MNYHMGFLTDGDKIYLDRVMSKRTNKIEQKKKKTMIIVYSRSWGSFINDLPALRNISEKLMSKTCEPAYRASLSTKYFSGSSSRSVAAVGGGGASTTDLLTITPGANRYESAASNSPSTMSISVFTSSSDRAAASSTAERDSSAAKPVATVQHNTTTAVRAAAVVTALMSPVIARARRVLRWWPSLSNLAGKQS